MEIVLLLVVFVGFIWFSNRRRKKASQQLEESVKVGSKAVMLGGITGVITEIREGSLILETVPGTKIEFLKAAVRSVEAPSLDSKPAKVKSAPAAKKSPATKETSAKAKSTTAKSAK